MGFNFPEVPSTALNYQQCSRNPSIFGTWYREFPNGTRFEVNNVNRFFIRGNSVYFTVHYLIEHIFSAILLDSWEIIISKADLISLVRADVSPAPDID